MLLKAYLEVNFIMMLILKTLIIFVKYDNFDQVWFFFLNIIFHYKNLVAKKNLNLNLLYKKKNYFKLNKK